MQKKSQSAVEFIVLASFMFLVTLGFFAVTNSKILEAKDDSNKKISSDIAEFVYREIETAKSVNDGYTRVFVIPQTINGINYNISIRDNRELLVNYLGNEYIKFLPPNITGNISTGIIKISKFNDMVFINATEIQPPPPLANLLMKNNLLNVISFYDNGNVAIKGTLQQNSNQQPTIDDEFIVKDRNGNVIAIVNLVTGNMFIKGILQQNQAVLSPSSSSSDFIIKKSNGNVISFIDESGNFFMRGVLTQHGNP